MTSPTTLAIQLGNMARALRTASHSDSGLKFAVPRGLRHG
jgi:hypothetical protein